MNFWRFLVFLNFSIGITVADFTSDLEKVIVAHNCDPFCTFNQSEITSTTVPFFPGDCHTICGILILNQNTDLSEFDLKKLFENMTTLFGGIILENSKFQELPIFGKDPQSKKFEFFCGTAGLSIRNNSQLVNIDFLDDFFLWKDRSTDECALQFENNPKLDVRFLCKDERYKDMFELTTIGNVDDCGCRGDRISLDTIESLQNCTVLYGGLHISNLTTFSGFSNIIHVKGDVEIQMTNFKNLSFLEKLRIFEVKHGVISERVALNVHDNPEMTRFGMTGLKSLYDILNGPFIINLESLHPDFCLTIQEIQFFLENYISFKNIQAKFCPGIESTVIRKLPICVFKSMRDLEEYCSFVYGNLLIGVGDEEYTYKLRYVTHLFGTLTITNTVLVDLKFFFELQYIASLEDEYVIEIVGNANLTSSELPSLKNIISRGSRTVVLHSNPNLISDDCMIFPLYYQTNVAFIGDNCVTHKKLRRNSVYVIMAGIAICDLVTMFSSIYEWVEEYVSLWNGVDCLLPRGYLQIALEYYLGGIQDILRRQSTWLALLMASIRLLIVKYPLNSKFSSLSNRSFALKSILILLSINILISFFRYVQYTIKDVGVTKIRFCDHLPKNYTVPHTYDVVVSDFVDGFRILAYQYMMLSDGIAKTIPAVTLPFLAFSLIRCMQKASKARKSLMKSGKDHETEKSIKMVALMTVFSVIAEGPAGVVFAIKTFFVEYRAVSVSGDSLEVILVNLVVLNAIVHCFICYTVSSQYQETVRLMFLPKRLRKNKIGVEPNVFSTGPRVTASNAVVG